MERERNKILAAIDGSEQTHELVDYLSGIIPAQETEIVLFHVMAKIPDSLRNREKDPQTARHIENLKKWEVEREKQVRDLMRSLRRQFVSIGMPEYSTMISIQKAKEGIAKDLLNEAQRGYNAVLIGRGRTGGVGGQVLGSVAMKLGSKLSSANLWLVGKRPPRGKILIALDSSDAAMRAVRHVGSMIDRAAHSLELLHIVRGISVSAAGREKIFPEEYRQRLIEEAENQIRPAFDKAVEILTSAGIARDRISTKVISGVPSQAGAIYEEAMREGFGTVVLGRKGLSNIQEFDMGRVSAKLVQLAGGFSLWMIA